MSCFYANRPKVIPRICGPAFAYLAHPGGLPYWACEQCLNICLDGCDDFPEIEPYLLVFMHERVNA